MTKENSFMVLEPPMKKQSSYVKQKSSARNSEVALELSVI